MKRWAWNSFCLISLLVFLFSITIWARSYWVQDSGMVWKNNPVPEDSTRRQLDNLGVEWSRGSIRIFKLSVEGEDGAPGAQSGPQPIQWGFGHLTPLASLILPESAEDKLNLQFAGFQVDLVSMTRAGREQSWMYLVVPLWLFLPAVIPPIIWWRRRPDRGGRGFPVAVAKTILANDGAPMNTDNLE